MKYPLEKQGSYKDSREIIPDGHLLDKFSEPMSERIAFVKCLCDCPIHKIKPCKRHSETMPKHKLTLGRPYQQKDNLAFCAFHVGMDNKDGRHKPDTFIV